VDVFENHEKWVWKESRCQRDKTFFFVAENRSKLSLNLISWQYFWLVLFLS